MMDKIIYWVMEDDTEIGTKRLEGSPSSSSLAVPMMVLCIINQIEVMDSSLSEKYNKATEWALKEVMKHIKVRRYNNWSLFQREKCFLVTN